MADGGPGDSAGSRGGAAVVGGLGVLHHGPAAVAAAVAHRAVRRAGHLAAHVGAGVVVAHVEGRGGQGQVEGGGASEAGAAESGGAAEGGAAES